MRCAESFLEDLGPGGDPSFLNPFLPWDRALCKGCCQMLWLLVPVLDACSGETWASSAHAWGEEAVEPRVRNQGLPFLSQLRVLDVALTLPAQEPWEGGGVCLSHRDALVRVSCHSSSSTRCLDRCAGVDGSSRLPLTSPVPAINLFPPTLLPVFPQRLVHIG